MVHLPGAFWFFMLYVYISQSVSQSVSRMHWRGVVVALAASAAMSAPRLAKLLANDKRKGVGLVPHGTTWGDPGGVCEMGI